MTDLVIITILGRDPDTETWLGLRPFLEKLQSLTPGRIDLRSAVWNDEDQLREVGKNTLEGRKVIVIGHSYGGDSAIELLNGEHGPCGPVNNLILLDPKPVLGEEPDEWAEMSGHKYQKPASVEWMTVFHGNFGAGATITDTTIPFWPVSDITIHLPGIIDGHASFPGHPIIQFIIFTQVQARLKETV